MSTSWPDLYLQHYQRFLGKPFDVKTYHGDGGASVRVGTYDQRFRDFHVYASAGLSAHADRLQGVGEIVMFDDEKGRDVPKLFVNYVLFILQHNIPLTGPFTIGGLDNLNAAFADYYDRVAVQFFHATGGVGPGFEVVKGDGEIGQIFYGLFISGGEADFIKRQGVAAFEEKLETQTFALNRRSCV